MVGRKRKLYFPEDPMEGCSKQFVTSKSKPIQQQKQTTIGEFLRPLDLIAAPTSDKQTSKKPAPSSKNPAPTSKKSVLTTKELGPTSKQHASTSKQPASTSQKPVAKDKFKNRVKTYVARKFLESSNVGELLKNMFVQYNLWEQKKHRMEAYANDWLINYRDQPERKLAEGLRFHSAHQEAKIWFLLAHPEINSDDMYMRYLEPCDNHFCYIDLSLDNELLKLEKRLAAREVKQNGQLYIGVVKSLSERVTRHRNDRVEKKARKMKQPVTVLQDLPMMVPDETTIAQIEQLQQNDFEWPSVTPPETPDDEMHLKVLQSLPMDQFVTRSNVRCLYQEQETDLNASDCEDPKTETEFITHMFNIVQSAKTLSNVPFRLKNWPELEAILVEGHDAEQEAAAYPSVSVPYEKPEFTMWQFLKNTTAIAYCKHLTMYDLIPFDFVIVNTYKRFLSDAVTGVEMTNGHTLSDFKIPQNLSDANILYDLHLFRTAHDESSEAGRLKRTNTSSIVDGPVLAKRQRLLLENPSQTSSMSWVSSMAVTVVENPSVPSNGPRTSTPIATATPDAAKDVTIKVEILDNSLNQNSEVICMGEMDHGPIELDDSAEKDPDELFGNMAREVEIKEAGKGVLSTRNVFRTEEPPSSDSLTGSQESQQNSPSKQKMRPVLKVVPTTKRAANKKIQYDSDTPEKSVPSAKGAHDLLNLDSSLFVSAEVNQVLTTTPSSSLLLPPPLPPPLRYYQPTKQVLALLDIHSIVYNDQPYRNGDHFKVSLVLKQFGVWRVAVHDTDIPLLFNIGAAEWQALLRLLHRFKYYHYVKQPVASVTFDVQRDLIRHLLNLYFRWLPRLCIGGTIEFGASLNYMEDDVRVTRTTSTTTMERYESNTTKIDPWILEQMRLAKCEWKRKTLLKPNNTDF